MYEAIKKFSEQFSFEPKIENTAALGSYKKFLIAGMGGSNLAAGLLQIAHPELDIIPHRSYGLPEHSGDRLIIASSYSGNTEETIDAFETALKRNQPLAVISAGGKLIDRAKEQMIPYIQIPNTGIQPRSALGFNTRALAKIMQHDAIVQELASVPTLLAAEQAEKEGKALAEHLQTMVPVIYSSQANFPIAYNWKIKFNETGKIPAWANVFPELNHNEMTGFDRIDSTRSLSEKLSFVFLHDPADHPKIQQRMEVTQKVYEDRGLPVTVLELKGSPWEKIFNSLLTADWTAYYTAEHYGAQAEQVPMVEEFKKLIKN